MSVNVTSSTKKLEPIFSENNSASVKKINSMIKEAENYSNSFDSSLNKKLISVKPIGSPENAVTAPRIYGFSRCSSQHELCLTNNLTEK